MWLAHSAENDIKAQEFQIHNKNGHVFITNRFLEIKKYFPKKDICDLMMNITLIAYLFHDVGKLDDECQAILNKTVVADKMLNHVDAGVAILLLEYDRTKNLIFLYAAILVHAHHIGLQDFSELIGFDDGGLFKKAYFFYKSKIRDLSSIKEKYNIEGTSVKDHIDSRVNIYLDRLNESLSKLDVDLKSTLYNEIDKISIGGSFELSSNDFRMMLSILVDADHTDTTINYGGDYPIETPKLNPKKRIKKLNAFIKSLKTEDNDVYRIRKKLYNCVSRYNMNGSFSLLDTPVGSGKTYSGLKLGLRICEKYGLERFIYVAPFNNIITQTTDVYRDSIVLKGENKEEVVDECCIQMEYDDPRLRKFAKLWKSPFVTTTAVQFMETLFSNKTSKLRKLHRYIGSFIFIDEYHQSMDLSLWPITLKYLKELADKFSIKVVFASGSSVELWNTSLCDNINIDVDKIVKGRFYKELQKVNNQRCKIERLSPFLNIDDFIKFVLDKNGSKLIILDTVRNSVIVKNKLKEMGITSFYLSTTTSPSNRKNIIERVKKSLKENKNTILISTSCVECGVDFSFDFGFREDPSFNSALQSSGRVNRNFENEHGTMYIFTITDENSGFTSNFKLNVSKSITNSFKDKDIIPENCTKAANLEISRMKKESVNNIALLNKLDNLKDFPGMAQKYKIIDSETIPVIVNKEIVQKIKDNKKVSTSEIYANSVQIFMKKSDRLLEKKLIAPIFQDVYGNNLFEWLGEYDPDGLGIALDQGYLE